jgi:hypothetical protein
MMTTTTVNNTADWHAHQAIKAYRRRDDETYTRHIVQCDCLRSWAAELVRWSGR